VRKARFGHRANSRILRACKDRRLNNTHHDARHA
jgi:hypothetical protein